MRKHIPTTAPARLLTIALLTAAVLPLSAGCSTTQAIESNQSSGAYPLRKRTVTSDDARQPATGAEPNRIPGAYPLRG